MPRAAVQFALMILLVGGILWRESDREPLRNADTAFVDWLAANARTKPEPASTTLIEIDDDSINPEHPWPWSPLEYAVFLKSLEPTPPKLVGIVPVLGWDGEREDSLEGDDPYVGALHSAVLRLPKVLLAARLGRIDDPDVVPPMASVPMLANVSGPLNEIPEFSALSSEPSERLRLSPEIGFTNLPGSNRGVARSVPMLFRYRGELVPAFSLQAAMLWFDVAPDEVEVRIGRHIRLGESAELPIDRAGEFLVDFRVPIARHSYPELILSARERALGTRPQISDEELVGAAVFLARSDKAAPKIPFANGRSGTEGQLFAHALATAQAKTAPRRIAPLFDAALVAAAALLLPLSLKIRWRPFLGILILLDAVYLLAAISLYAQSHLCLPLVLPTGLLVAGFIWRIASPPLAAKETAS